jgi:hypothetical protein
VDLIAPEVTGDCTKCKSGFFGDEVRKSDDYACKACPATYKATFNFLIGGEAHTVSVDPITEPGATSAQHCLLEFAAVQVDNW